MGCCYCCLSQNDKIDRVIDKFSSFYVSLANVKEYGFPQLVAGRILPAGPILIAPVSGKPCLYYNIVAEEQVETVRVVHENGNERIERDHHWETRYTNSNKADFYLVDPNSPGVSIYIPLSQQNHRINSAPDSVVEQFRPSQARGQHFMAMVQNHQSFNHFGSEWRFTESKFSIGEQCALLGVVSRSPYGALVLQAVSSSVLTEDYFKNNNWSEWDINSWKELTAEAAIIATDVPDFLKNNPIPMIPNGYTVAAPYPQQPSQQPPMNFPGQHNALPSQPQQAYYPPQQQQQHQQGDPVSTPPQPGYPPTHATATGGIPPQYPQY